MWGCVSKKEHETDVGKEQGDRDRQREDSGLAVTVGKEDQVEEASNQPAVSQLKSNSWTIWRGQERKKGRGNRKGSRE